jgi:hypothetical protein
MQPPCGIVRRVHIGASCTPIATEHLLDLFIGRQIAPSRASFDNLTPLFHLADESRDLLLLVRRPAQHAAENCFYVILFRISDSNISAVFASTRHHDLRQRRTDEPDPARHHTSRDRHHSIRRDPACAGRRPIRRHVHQHAHGHHPSRKQQHSPSRRNQHVRNVIHPIIAGPRACACHHSLPVTLRLRFECRLPHPTQTSLVISAVQLKILPRPLLAGNAVLVSALPNLTCRRLVSVPVVSSFPRNVNGPRGSVGGNANHGCARNCRS